MTLPQKPTFSRRTLARLVGTALPARAESAPVRPMVFFSKTVSAQALMALYDRCAPSWKGRIGIKIHGGEAGVNYPLFLALQQHVPQSNFVETNWASDFGGDRRHTRTHLEEIRRQGVKAPVDILDREENDYVSLPVRGGKELQSIEVPQALVRDYAGVVVLTNFKMPSFAGFTGAAKNIGIGLVSPDAKSRVHGAGYERSHGFFWRMADAVKGVTEAMTGRMICISLLTDVCASESCGVTPATGTLGIVASTDPTAADQAACDLVWGLSHDKSAALTERQKIDSGYLTLEALSANRCGSRDYQLIEI